MASLQSLKKAYDALKDSTKVGLAHVNSDYTDLDVAIVKATNHVECPPKDRHLRKIIIATSAVRPRADVGYCIHALSKRLAKTRNWTVTLKTLIVIHRTLREGDPTFKEEILNYSQRVHILRLSSFKDESSPIAWDCSAWVRTYALFLEERLECFRVLKYDVESVRLPKPGEGHENGYSRTRDLTGEQLLEQLPALQQLLFRLIGCRPEGAAVGNYVIQYALALVLKESFKVYCAVNDGIINLIDKFFEMPRHEAIIALEIYRRAGQQAVSLSDFYEVCKGLELARNFQFPVLREPPRSFLATMEEYIREAPRMVPISREQLEFPERLLLTYGTEESSIPEEDSPLPVPPTLENNADAVDFLGLSAEAAVPDASSVMEEGNALALAIVPSDDDGMRPPPYTGREEFNPSGWELALVSAPSSSTSSLEERKLAGGMDAMTLNSLYDQGPHKTIIYGGPPPAQYNPFEVSDPFPFAPHRQDVDMPVTPSSNNPFMDESFAPHHHPPLPHNTNPFLL